MHNFDTGVLPCLAISSQPFICLGKCCKLKGCVATIGGMHAPKHKPHPGKKRHSLSSKNARTFHTRGETLVCKAQADRKIKGTCSTGTCLCREN